MRPFRVLVLGCALIAALASARPVQAAWNNVFQVCCSSCGGSPTIAMASPVDCCDPCPQPCAPACPQQVCTTRYIQRSYYQPVTTYRTSFYYEPVTTYRTSYYYEPCTSYRYSCCYDPCTCRYQQVATPVTSYRLRSQCCPVTSYLQRCCLTPCTSYQQMTYYEPQTTCCSTTPGVSVPAVTAPAAVAPATTPPVVGEQRQPALTPAPGAPNVSEKVEPAPAGPGDGSTRYDRNPPFSAPKLQSPIPVGPNGPAPRSGVRLDRMASTSGDALLHGQVLTASQLPQANAKVVLISTAADRTQRQATTDASGRFQLNVSAGGWLVYVQGADGRHVYHQKIEVTAKEAPLVRLVSR